MSSPLSLPGLWEGLQLDPRAQAGVEQIPESQRGARLGAGSGLPAQPGSILPEPDTMAGLAKSCFLLPTPN